MGWSWSAALAAALSLAAGATSAACDLHAPNAGEAGRRCAQAWMDRNLHMNDIMSLGTHNSYHMRTPDKVMDLIRQLSPRSALGLDYNHESLRELLDDGDRAVEIDLALDPQGGRFASPAGARLAGIGLDPAWVAAMSRPGIKVLHIQDIDYTSNCVTFVQCLAILRDWSRAHPRHVPILITMNTNDAKSRAPGGTDELPFTTAAYDSVDAEIRSVFRPGELITPDDIRGHYPTLREAVLKHGWPTLGAARGKVLFALDEGAAHVDAYRAGHPALEGRALFVNTDEASPAAAYLTLNEHSDLSRILADIKAGFLVRTRADADTVEARTNSTARRDAALQSGAQYVSTDYRHPDTRFSGYQVRLPGDEVAVCNPQRAPERCAGIPVE